MHNVTLDKRLFEIHNLINPALHPDRPDPERIELAEELLEKLRYDLAQEMEPHDPERYRLELIAALRREMSLERFAKLLASLTDESLAGISVEFLSPPPTKYVLQITEENNHP